MEKNENTNIKNENIILSKDPLYNEIQEILMDQEMIQKKLLEQNEISYNLEIIFPGELILKKYKVNFLLIIPKKYPKQEPELYSLTVFSHPHLSDGRNLINDILKNEWTYDNIPIDVIINRIPKFIIKCSEYININKSINIGKYSLNHLYPINLLKNLPIFFHLIPENNNIITIGDISLCLYELEKENNFKYCKLLSFINIKDIIEIQSNQKSNFILIKYKYDKTTKKMNINTQIYKTIEDILKEKMKLYKKKTGKIPDIDIIYLEKEIAEKEKELLNKEKGEQNIYMYKEKCLRLMDLYQQSIEYYSAVNDPKYMNINIKIHKLIERTKLTSISDIKDNKDNDKIPKEEKDNIETNKIEDKKEIIEKKEIKENNDIKKKEKDKKEIVEKKEEKKKEEKIKEKKEEKNKDEENNSLRLKIDEKELNTLDVGEDEDEEEEDDDDNNKNNK